MSAAKTTTVQKQVRWPSDLKPGDVIVSVQAQDTVTVDREVPVLVMGTAFAGREGERRAPMLSSSRGYYVSGGHLNERDVTDVRPLVVIDPADVDVEALVAATYGSGADTRHLVVIALLNALGIEVDR